MRFEQPIPIPQININEISFTTKDEHIGEFNIKNTSGGILSGRIICHSPAFSFAPTNFTGNNQKITYKFSPDKAKIKPGETYETDIIIYTNGGEIRLPIKASFTKLTVTTAEGINIASIDDFYIYAKDHPSSARRIFTDNDFYMFLLSQAWEYVDIYDSLHKDANRERALDNFFILAGKKKATELYLPDKTIEFIKKPGDNDILYGNFTVKKSDSGYYESPITALGGVPWLTLSASRIISSDFNNENTAVINFTIDPAKIITNYARERILIGTGKNILEIVYKKSRPIIVKLVNENIRFDDKGRISIINNTGKLIKIELVCSDNFIKFQTKNIIIENAYQEVPFDVKLSPFTSARLMFSRQPYIRTQITLKATAPGWAMDLNLPVTVGEW